MTAEPPSTVCTVLPVVTRVAVLARLIGPKKVLPPVTRIAALPVPLPVSDIAPMLVKPLAVVEVATGETMFPLVVSISRPMALAVLLLAMEPELETKLLELSVTAAPAAAIPTPPADSMVMLPPADVVTAVDWVEVMSVSARATWAASADASRAPAAAESIKRCLFTSIPLSTPARRAFPLRQCLVEDPTRVLRQAGRHQIEPFAKRSLNRFSFARQHRPAPTRGNGHARDRLCTQQSAWFNIKFLPLKARCAQNKPVLIGC